MKALAMTLGILTLTPATACHGTDAASPAPTAKTDGRSETARPFKKPGDGELRKQLTPLQYEVTQHGATEPPFDNAYWNNHEAGIYVDVVSGEPLFSSTDKFDSGTGWPSFSRPIEPDNVVRTTNESLMLSGVEVHSRLAGSHLGHVFADGPAPTGLRYCIDSASLRFVPESRLAEEGLGQYAKRFHK